MPITHESFSRAYIHASNVTADKPTGTAEGDLLLAFYHLNKRDEVTGLPAGWTLIGDTGTNMLVRGIAAYKVAGAAEPLNYTFTGSGMFFSQKSVVIHRFSGTDITSPIGESNLGFGYPDFAQFQNEGTFDIPDISLTNSTYLVRWAGVNDDGDDGTLPVGDTYAGHTKLQVQRNPQLGDISLSKDTVVTGAAGPLTITTESLDGGKVDYYVAFNVGLQAVVVPLNTTLPTLSITATDFTGSVGTWDAQNGGTLTYQWELREMHTDVVVASAASSVVSGSGTFSGEYYLWVEASNGDGFGYANVAATVPTGVDVPLTATGEAESPLALVVLQPRSYSLSPSAETESAIAVGVAVSRRYTLGIAAEAEAPVSATAGGPRSYLLTAAIESESVRSLAVRVPDPLIGPRLSVAQPPRSGDDYPFLIDGQPMSSAIFDLVVEYIPGQHRLPLKITQLTLPAALDASAMIVVKDADDEIVIVGSSVNAAYQTWGQAYTAYQWSSSTGILRAVVSNAAGDFSSNKPTLIDPRVCVPRLQGVTGVVVHPERGDSSSVGLSALAGIDFREGYNMSLVPTPGAARTYSGGRVGGTLGFNATPGSGAGVFEHCEDTTPYLQTINGQSAVAGNFLVNGTDCFRLEPILTESGGVYAITPGQLQLSDDCEPCCDCDDYLQVYRSVDRLQRRTRNTAEYLEDLRDQYEPLRGATQAQLECHNRRFQLDVRRSDDCEIAIAGSVYNDTNAAIDELTVYFQFYTWQDDALRPIAPAAWPEVAGRYSQEQDYANTPLKYWAPNIVRVKTSCLEPDKTATLGFRLTIATNEDVYVSMWVDGMSELRLVRRTPTACVSAAPAATTTTAEPTTTTTAAP